MPTQTSRPERHPTANRAQLSVVDRTWKHGETALWQVQSHQANRVVVEGPRCIVCVAVGREKPEDGRARERQDGDPYQLHVHIIHVDLSILVLAEHKLFLWVSMRVRMTSGEGR